VYLLNASEIPVEIHIYIQYIKILVIDEEVIHIDRSTEEHRGTWWPTFARPT
jgi:hypothetical protein